MERESEKKQAGGGVYVLWNRGDGCGGWTYFDDNVAHFLYEAIPALDLHKRALDPTDLCHQTIYRQRVGHKLAGPGPKGTEPLRFAVWASMCLSACVLHNLLSPPCIICEAIIQHLDFGDETILFK